MERFTEVKLYFSVSKNQNRIEHDAMQRIIRDKLHEAISNIEKECRVIPTNLILEFKD